VFPCGIVAGGVCHVAEASAWQLKKDPVGPDAVDLNAALSCWARVHEYVRDHLKLRDDVDNCDAVSRLLSMQVRLASP
jgi:hypothetical protein